MKQHHLRCFIPTQVFPNLSNKGLYRQSTTCSRPSIIRVAPTLVASSNKNEIAFTTVPSSTRAAYPVGSYDYIIVGGGAAGCVLANRLSTDPNIRVLLLEAGPRDDSFYLNVPLGFPYLLGSRRDWAFLTEPEPTLNNRRLYFPRGKLVGGSHAISVMLYHRGHPVDYEHWAEVADQSWGPNEVLSYFRKSESQTSTAKKSSPAHGSDGPLAVSDLARLNPMSAAFLNAATQEGLPGNDDFNDWTRDQDGVGSFQVTQRNGCRESPATAFLNGIRNRRNLKIETGVTVEKIEFSKPQDGQLPCAEKVIFADSEGKRCIVTAEKEIVLAAGVYGSPQLLMLSGVGSPANIQKFGIEMVANLPSVGQNLQDHPAVMLSYESKHPQKDKSDSTTYYTEATGKNIGTVLNYLFRGKGPLTSPMCEAGGFVKTDPSQKACDLQLRFIPFVSEPDPYGSLADFARGGTYLENSSNRPAGFTLQSVAARPKSRGWVELRSPDVRDTMSIHSNWMSDERDMQTLIQGIKLSRRIASNEHFNDFRGREVCPGDEATTEQDIKEYIRKTCHTANAMVGTCRMGSDSESVVDPELRVRGVRNLRVVDSSIMPTLPGGQSGAPTMMIAEKGADLILGVKNGVRAASESETIR